MTDVEPTLERLYRHTLPVRLAHWINVACLFLLVMSGLQIFNAHPALYWGERSDPDRALLSIEAVGSDENEPVGLTTVLGHTFDTTGVLGVSTDSERRVRSRGFPSWVTLPGPQWLAMGRRWHFFAAWLFVLNGALFALYSLAGRHLRRDLLPSWRDLRGLGGSIVDHLRFRHPTGDAAGRYNGLQKLAYLGVIFGLGPLIVWTGLAMSPRMDAAFPWLSDVWGGRQSARTVHFTACVLFIGYVVVHVVMVAATGLWNNLRSMISGWYRLPPSTPGGTL